MSWRECFKEFYNGLDFKERIFYALSGLGLVAAVTAFVSALAYGLDEIGLLATGLCGVYLVIVVIYSLFSRNIKNSQWLICLGYNFVLFPITFFCSGGSSGGMPEYFVLGIIIINLMLKGNWCYILSAAAIALDTSLMLYGYYHPTKIVEFDSSFLALIDQLQGVIIVSILIGLVIKSFSHEYDKQNVKIQAMNEKLMEMALVDPLTELYNRRYLRDRMTDLLENVKQSNNKLSVIMFDIDFFKKVNDEHGHLAGDRVLQSVAETLKSHIRNCDIVGRYGGEEFLVVLDGADRQEAISIAERIRHNIEQSPQGREYKIRLTISGGVAEYRAGMDFEALIMAADENLYKAKESGRNRIAA